MDVEVSKPERSALSSDHHASLPPDRAIDTDILCLTCGYNLRGLAAQGGCPECGTAVATSLGASRILSRRDLATLCLRLMATITVIWHLPRITIGLFFFTSMLLDGVDAPWLYSLLYAFDIAAICGGSVALWWFAPRLATKLFGHDAAIARGSSLTRASVLAIGALLLGVYFAADGAVGTAVYAAERGLMMFSDLHQEHSLLDDAARALIGLVLIWKAPVIGIWGAKRIKATTTQCDRGNTP